MGPETVPVFVAVAPALGWCLLPWADLHVVDCSYCSHCAMISCACDVWRSCVCVGNGVCHRRVDGAYDDVFYTRTGACCDVDGRVYVCLWHFCAACAGGVCFRVDDDDDDDDDVDDACDCRVDDRDVDVDYADVIAIAIANAYDVRNVPNLLPSSSTLL